MKNKSPPLPKPSLFWSLTRSNPYYQFLMYSFKNILFTLMCFFSPPICHNMIHSLMYYFFLINTLLEVIPSLYIKTYKCPF